ncbi:MAG: DUF2147 domain-containing protein [Pseudomonadota bacterium]
MMKRLVTAAGFVLALFITPISAEPLEADAILGTYINPDRSRTVKVYKDDGRYFGVIATAPEIPDGNEGVGFIVFKDFEFNPEKGVWENGRLDSPMQPKIEFSGRLSIDENGDLIVRGFFGLPVFGGSSVFPRVKG